MRTARRPLLALALLPCAACPLVAHAQVAHADGHIRQTVENELQPDIDAYSLDLAVQAGGGVTFDDFGPNLPSRHAQANSLAQGTGVHSHTYAQIITPPLGPAGINQYHLLADASAYVLYTDMVISGPVGGAVSTSLNLHLDGSHIAGDSTIVGFGQTFASSLVDISVAIEGTPLADGVHSVSVVSGGNPVVSSVQMLANWDTSHDFSTPAFTVTVGVPFQVKLFMHTQASVGAFPYNTAGFSAEANADFSNTFSFATTGNVFNLPAGYTATSAQAAILNNTVIPAPEPATLSLLAAPLLLLRARRPRSRPLLPS
jgi:hypothetical protein